MGILSKFSAVLVGRPKTCDGGREPNIGREKYKLHQWEAIARAIQEYCPTALPIPVFNMDFGHTDPQTLVPCGAMAYIDAEGEEIFFDYSNNCAL